MKGKIYCITNQINNKVYIGKTLLTIEKRFNQHKLDSKKNKDRIIYKAFKKYGIENFSIREIEEVEESILEEREIFYIKKFNSYVGFENSNGYNSTLGGEGRRYFKYSDKEVIKKYKELKYISYTAKFFNADEETISKILKSNNIKMTKNGEHSKKSICMISKDGEIKNFNSIKETAEFLLKENIPKTKDLKYVVKGVSRVVNNVSNTYMGYYFKEA